MSSVSKHGLWAITFPFSEPVSRVYQHPSPQLRLNLVSVSKTEHPLRLVQAAVSGVIFLRTTIKPKGYEKRRACASHVFAVKGDLISARWFLWGAIANPAQFCLVTLINQSRRVLDSKSPRIGGLGGECKGFTA
jgi:hypothetical protein